jgi:hypothetical protein
MHIIFSTRLQRRMLWRRDWFFITRATADPGRSLRAGGRPGSSDQHDSRVATCAHQSVLHTERNRRLGSLATGDVQWRRRHGGVARRRALQCWWGGWALQLTLHGPPIWPVFDIQRESFISGSGRMLPVKPAWQVANAKPTTRVRRAAINPKQVLQSSTSFIRNVRIYTMSRTRPRMRSAYPLIRTVFSAREPL